MDIEKLIDDYRKAADKWEKRHPVTDTFDLRVQDALREAATALSTLQAENEKLRAELEQMAACVYYKQGGLCRLGGADPANVCVMGPCPNQVSVWNLLTEMVLCPERLPTWVRPEMALPPEENLVLVIVSGRPSRNIRLVYAVELATWTRKDGWVLDEFPDYECPKIHFWAPIPELPEEARV